MRKTNLILIAICALLTSLLAAPLLAASTKEALPTRSSGGNKPQRVEIVAPTPTPVVPVTPKPTPSVTPKPGAKPNAVPPVTPKPTPVKSSPSPTPTPTPASTPSPAPTPVAAPASAQEKATPTPATSPVPSVTPPSLAPPVLQPAPGSQPPAPPAPAPGGEPAPGPGVAPNDAAGAAPGGGTAPGATGATGGVNKDGEKTASIFFPTPKPIGVILDEFTFQTKARITLCGKASAMKLAFTGNDLTAEAFLKAISGANKMRWRKIKDGYELWDEESYLKEVVPTQVQQKVFVPVYVPAKYLYEAIKQSNVLTAQVGNVALDERTNKVIVSDVPEKLALVQSMFDLLDEPQVTRVFPIRYAVIKDLVEKIKQFKSEAGSIESDELAHLIIVRDTMANIQQMEVMIDLLDVRQIGRVYNLNSIGLEGGKDVENLDKNLKLLITKDAFYLIDEVRGLLILRDTPEVHEDVEKFLQVFDRPIDQLRIDAELLDVDQTSLFTLGMEYAFSGDLPSAVADNLIGGFPKAGSTTNESAGSTTGNPFGFVNYKNEFPLGTAGSGGLSASYLSSRVKAQLTALMTDSNTIILSQPRVMVKNKEKVKLADTNSIPIAQINSGTSFYNNSTSSTSYNPVVTTTQATGGLTIEIEPTIAPTGLVEMSVFIENKTVDPVTIESGVSGQKLQAAKDATDSIDTVLIVPDGETRVISGLIRRQKSDARSGVPFLMKIPVIGSFLFGDTKKNDRVRNLLFFVTPTIMREQAKGKLVAYEFDQMPTKNKWESSDIPAEVKDALNDAAEGLTTSTQRGKRFSAPTPDEFRARMDAGATTDTLSTRLPGDEDQSGTDNTPEGLAKALRAGGGTLPDFAEDQKSGFSGDLGKAGAGGPTGPGKTPTAQPGPTPPTTPQPMLPPVQGGKDTGGPKPRPTPTPKLEPVTPQPVKPPRFETNY
jgi:type II secretory pathway component GspD/PulD (secretin)